MRILKCIAIDDEPLPLELLQDYIEKTPFLELMHTYNNPLEALAALRSQPVDLIFLDIQMPELNGLKLTALLGDSTKVILTTAYREFAVEGFELNAIDYLLKPISFERFLKAATKALQTIQPPVAAILPVAAHEPFIFVKTTGRLQKVMLEDILYIEGLKEYVALHTISGKVVTLQHLKKLEAALPAKLFMRVHKSFIVALNKIESIERNRIFIKDTVIPVGDLYREMFQLEIQRKSISG
ncbi:DNA-binding LytR/AlgR family response regulator [Chitinophaga dinghuensis]|uniref:DNA-binding LytR/AlgR family response regulator n=1 Tax=Chitinophaga dinghuensis TaxID=1539050 RepID=A0A327W308_9BACT|nr:LytTR family DNA-binding domain-containing protein [Chitinophaga dinghuensis]RAJ83597.1 DNA-binding LytR/AlgR family response regulator [Chitinophaga dinghuensis]